MARCLSEILDLHKLFVILSWSVFVLPKFVATASYFLTGDLVNWVAPLKLNE